MLAAADDTAFPPQKKEQQKMAQKKATKCKNRERNAITTGDTMGDNEAGIDPSEIQDGRNF